MNVAVIIVVVAFWGVGRIKIYVFCFLGFFPVLKHPNIAQMSIRIK